MFAAAQFLQTNVGGHLGDRQERKKEYTALVVKGRSGGKPLRLSSPFQVVNGRRRFPKHIKLGRSSIRGHLLLKSVVTPNSPAWVTAVPVSTP
jgi:hypothetical protein